MCPTLRQHSRDLKWRFSRIFAANPLPALWKRAWAPLTTVAARLRCSKCHARGDCELTALDQKKPQGYRPER
jgi:hypothetical protein